GGATCRGRCFFGHGQTAVAEYEWHEERQARTGADARVGSTAAPACWRRGRGNLHRFFLQMCARSTPHRGRRSAGTAFGEIPLSAPGRGEIRRPGLRRAHDGAPDLVTRPP